MFFGSTLVQFCKVLQGVNALQTFFQLKKGSRRICIQKELSNLKENHMKPHIRVILSFIWRAAFQILAFYYPRCEVAHLNSDISIEIERISVIFHYTGLLLVW